MLWAILKKHLKLNITIYTLVNCLLRIAYKYLIHVTSTWTFVLFCRKWANTNWLCNMQWKLWYWSRMSWFRNCLALRQKTNHKRVSRARTSRKSLRIDLSCFALLTITLLWNRNSLNSIRLRWIHMLRLLRAQASTSEKDTLWLSTWTRSSLRLPRKLPASFRKPCRRHRTDTRRESQWLS